MQRIKYIDIAKGFLIILLVFAHFRSVTIRMSQDSPYFEFVYCWNNVFTAFYMPAFFIISGYCSNFNKTAKSFFISQVKSLIIPLISLWFISTILDAVLQGQNIIEEIKDVFVNGMGLWFLQALFLGKLIVYWIVKVQKKTATLISCYTLLITFTLMVIGVMLDNYYKDSINLFYYRHAFIASFWICIGTYLKNNPIVYEKSLQCSFYIYPVVAVLTFFIHTSFTAVISITFKTLFFFIVYSYLGTMFLFFLCKRIKNNRILEYWGKNTLVVYGLHFPPYLYVANCLYDILIPVTFSTFILYITILFVVEYMICGIIMKLFEMRPFSYLIGKW